MIQKILIAVDGSAPAARAAQAGFDLAKQVRARVALLHVVDVGPAVTPDLVIVQEQAIRELKDAGRALLQQFHARFPHTPAAERLLVEGEAAETILCTARAWGADLVVLGSDSRGRLANFLLGGTADAVIRRAECPVLTVRLQPEKPARAAAAATAASQQVVARTPA